MSKSPKARLSMPSKWAMIRSRFLSGLTQRRKDTEKHVIARREQRERRGNPGAVR